MADLTIDHVELVHAIFDRIEELDISDAEAARRLGISPQRLSQWKRGARIILDADLQRDIAKFLRISPREVLEQMGWSVSSEALRGYLDLAA